MSKNSKDITHKTLTTSIEGLTKFIYALNSPTLDSADYILLTTKILHPEYANNETVQNIRMAFAINDYKQAYSLINDVLEPLQNTNKKLYDLLQEAQSKAKNNDVPENNQTRRYYENKMAQELRKAQSTKENFASMTKYSKLLKTLYPLTSGRAITDIDKAESILDLSYNLISKDEVLLTKYYYPIRMTNGSISFRKDRDEYTRDHKTGEKFFSMNPGMIKANSPLPSNERWSLAEINRNVDIFVIDKEIPDGFSRSNTTIPYVNSVSGSTYILIATLAEYINKYKDDPSLQKDINNIIQTFVSFLCNEGYHSFEEIYAVFNDKVVKEFFESAGISIDNIKPEILLSNDVIESTIQYSVTTNLSQATQLELKTGFVKTQNPQQENDIPTDNKPHKHRP